MSSSRHATPRTTEEWRLCAEDDSAELIQAAIQAGLRGDKPAIQALLDLLQAEGISDRQNVAVDTVTVRTSIAPGASPLTGIHRFEPASIPIAVCLALSRDGPATAEVSPGHLARMDWKNNFRKPRTSWGDDDERLIQGAISLWRPGGKGCLDAEDPGRLREILAAVARYVNHSESIAAFSRAQVGLRDLANAGQSMFQAGPAGVGTWVATYPLSPVVPFPIVLFCGRNLTGASRLLSDLAEDFPAEAASIARQVVRDVCAQTKDAKSLVLSALADMIGHRGDQDLANDWPTCEGSHIIAFLDVCMSLHPSRDTQVAQIRVLGAMLDADATNPGKAEERDKFVKSFLTLPGHGPRPALRDAIHGWSDLAAVSGELPKSSMPRNDGLHALKDLMITAASVHNHALLDVGRPFIQAAFDEPQGNWLTPEEMICSVAGLRSNAALAPEDLRKTLSFLAGMGAPVTLAFRLEAFGTSLLHTLAESDHSDQAAALIVALEVGCDPNVRNHLRRRPASCVKDPGRKVQWMAIEKSVAARKSALAALDEFDDRSPVASAGMALG